MDEFEAKLAGLSMLSCSWQSNALFKQEAKDLIGELATMQISGHDPIELAGRVGGLSGLIASQEVWLQEQADRLVASGQAERA